MLGEYGDTLDWKFIFWDQIDGFLSPVERADLSYPWPAGLKFKRVELPARRAYYRVATQSPNADSGAVTCGYWGLGPMHKVVCTLLEEDPALRIMVVCGENRSACELISRRFASSPNVEVYGLVPSLLPLLAQCACIITKSGISSLLEAQAARRKIFLLKAMPVAEANNARHALRHFGADWFSRDRLAEMAAIDPGLSVICACKSDVYDPPHPS